MDVAELREKLHQYVNIADEQHLSAIYILVADSISQGTEVYDEATMKMLYERREKHRNGLSKSYTIEESMKMVKQHKK